MPAKDHQFQQEFENREVRSGEAPDRFEPLLDTAEAARLLRIHSQDAAQKCPPRGNTCHSDWKVVAVSGFSAQ